MSDSKVAISLFGAGQDCARFWEALAKGALLLAERPTISATSMPIDGQHCLYFTGIDELSALLTWVFENPAASAQIASSGHEWALQNRKPSDLWLRVDQQAAQIQKRCNFPFLQLAIVLTWAWVYNFRAFVYLYWFKNLRHQRI